MESILDADILIVDDNKDLLRLLREQLTSAGYRNLRTAKSCALAREAFQAKRPELMILDINLPDGDGFTLFRSLRAQADIPALFLSARDADADRLFGLGLGADDYLTKPFLMQELLLRMQHILRRTYRDVISRNRPGILRLGDRTVHLDDAAVVCGRHQSVPHSYGTGAAAEAGGKSGPCGDLRCPLRQRLGRRLLWV